MLRTLCPDYGGVLTSGGAFWTYICECPEKRGVLISGVSIVRGSNYIRPEGIEDKLNDLCLKVLLYYIKGSYRRGIGGEGM